jgi:hypothetical protein
MTDSTPEPDWRDNRGIAGRQADMDRGAAAERMRMHAALHKLMAEKLQKLATLEKDVAEIERQLAEEMARV